MQATRIHLIHDLGLDDLTEYCKSENWSAFRAKQIWRWLYVQQATEWDSMTNIPVGIREQLASVFQLNAVSADSVETGTDTTRKILAELADGDSVEEVLIPAGPRRTVCISSQVGCKFACTFCASGQAGFHRNLSAGEMAGQVLLAARAFGDNPTNVVYMGIGEPFDNYDAVLKSVRIINHPEGFGIGARRITISTCGLIPEITRLSGEGIQVELSVSLHASDEALRSRLMPINKRYPIKELLPACREYTRTTGRIVTFEYTLIRGVNDSEDQARGLARLLAPLKCRVNLIPLSPVDEFSGRSSEQNTADMFMEKLADEGTNATARQSRGGSVNAACGQLRFGGKEAGTTDGS
jgi:23S rRNA (adenine2503-C2)-methyltransferase